jgi:hypothetical protein
MTDCTYSTSRNVVSGIVLFIYERRSIISAVFGIVAMGLALLASVGEHAPDKSSCEPRDQFPFIATQIVSPYTVTQGCPPGLKYTIRRRASALLSP